LARTFWISKVPISSSAGWVSPKYTRKTWPVLHEKRMLCHKFFFFKLLETIFLIFEIIENWHNCVQYEMVFNISLISYFEYYQSWQDILIDDHHFNKWTNFFKYALVPHLPLYPSFEALRMFITSKMVYNCFSILAHKPEKSDNIWQKIAKIQLLGRIIIVNW
jgi:hypothetical protein